MDNTDKYAAESSLVRVNLGAAAYGAGSILPAERFNFALCETSGNVVATARNGADGRILFPEIRLDSLGEYRYTIRPLSNASDSWITDNAVYPAIITVYEICEGVLSCTTAYPDGYPNFTFTRARLNASLVLFSSVSLIKPGKYVYEIAGTDARVGNFILDRRVCKVVVNAFDDKKGNLLHTVDYPEGYPLFVEKYNAPCEDERFSPFAVANAQIYARKMVRGTSFSHNGEFNFGLFNALGELKQKAQNQNGIVVFNVNFIFQGVYKYWIREIPVFDGNFLFDKRVYPVEVIVEKDYWGSLRARVNYPEDVLVFENIYRRNY